MNSLRRSTVFVVAALALVAGVSVARASTPAAVLTSCKGTVSVVQRGASTPASFGLPLADGDEVKTGPGGEAEIMFSAGNWVQIGPNSSMKIKGRASGGDTPDAASEKKAGSFEVVQNFLKLKSSDGTSAIGGLRSGEKVPALEPVAPCQTRIRTAQPEFRWRIQDPATELRLTVYGGGKVLWQTDVSNVTSAAYPASAPALEPGVSYSWTLETTDPLVSPPLRTPAAFFERIAPADAKTLDTDLSQLDANKPGPVTYHLMRASLFFDHGLVADAITETESAVAGDPGNGSLHTILGRLYAEAGRTRDAIGAMDKGQK
jgi:hypothetical protein